MTPEPQNLVEREKQRVLVIGSDGRLGRSLVKYLLKDHTVISLGRDQLDLLSKSGIKESLLRIDFSHVIITAALTGVDYCETHQKEAFLINAAAPGWIATIAADKRAHVTFISTDMVFDGELGDLYSESDNTNPANVYGASKIEGENLVLHASISNLVARTSWVYGPGRQGFPEWAIDQACNKTDLALPFDKISCPTYTVDLITWLIKLVFDQQLSAAGVFHLCNSVPCTWQEWGQSCLDTAGTAGVPILTRKIRGVSIDTVEAFIAKRPRNSAMSTQKFQEYTGETPRPWSDALADFLSLSPLLMQREESS